MSEFGSKNSIIIFQLMPNKIVLPRGDKPPPYSGSTTARIVENLPSSQTTSISVYMDPLTSESILPVVRVPTPLTSSLPPFKSDTESRNTTQQMDKLKTNVTSLDVKPAPNYSDVMSVQTKSPSKYIPPVQPIFLQSCQLSTKRK